MKDNTPTPAEFFKFAQGIDAIKSKNPRFKFNQNSMSKLKATTVYQFFIANSYFNDALRNFLSCRCIKNNPVIRAELPDQARYHGYVVLSLMGIAAKAFHKFFHAKASSAASIRVVTKKEKKPAIAACDYLLEEVINPRLISLPLADYMTLERLLVVTKKLLQHKEYSQFAERATGIPCIWERNLVFDESHATMLDKWIRAGRKRYLIVSKLNEVSRRENMMYDNYYR